MHDRKMPVQHRKWIAQDNQLAVTDSLLFRRKLFGTEEAATTLDRLFINRSGRAAYATRVVLDDHLGRFDRNAFGFNLLESISGNIASVA